MEDIKIRILNENDYEEYFRLINIFRETSFTKDDFLSNLLNIGYNSNIYVLELNNTLIGTGTILYEYKFIHNISKIAHIEDICIDNNHRGKNYGKTLIHYLINIAKKINCYKVTLYCTEELENFYNSCNMKKNGIQMAIYF